jgi:hypothetical protein
VSGLLGQAADLVGKVYQGLYFVVILVILVVGIGQTKS